MHRIIHRPLALAALVTMVGSALAVGLTGHLDPIESEVEDRVAELDGANDRASKKLRKRLQKVLKGLGKKSLTKSLKNEIRGSRKAVKQLEKALEGDSEIDALVDDLVDDYRSEVLVSRTVLSQQLTALTEGTRKHKKTSKKLDKADAFLARADEEADDVKRLKFLLKAVGKTGEADPAAGDRLTYVASSLRVALAGSGADITGDGQPNDGLSFALDSSPGAAQTITQVLEEQVQAGQIVLLIDAFGLDSLDADAVITIGIDTGVDADGQPGNNFDGNQEFEVPIARLDDEGRLSNSSTGSIVTGVASAVLPSAPISLTIGDTTLAPLGRVGFKGTLGASDGSGTITFAIPPSDARALIDAFSGEMPPPPGTVQSFLDIDTDGDGTPDALSASFELTLVRAEITPVE